MINSMSVAGVEEQNTANILYTETYITCAIFRS